MNFEPTQNRLAFVLPTSFLKAELTFSTSNGPEAVRVPIQPGPQARQVVSTERLAKGTWLAQLIWSVGRQEYQDEKLIVVS
jgi:hypothetical protein